MKTTIIALCILFAAIGAFSTWLSKQNYNYPHSPTHETSSLCGYRLGMVFTFLSLIGLAVAITR